MIGLPPGARDCLQVVRRTRRAANARLERPARKAIKVKIVKTKRPLELRDIRVGVACGPKVSEIAYASGGRRTRGRSTQPGMQLNLRY